MATDIMRWAVMRPMLRRKKRRTTPANQTASTVGMERSSAAAIRYGKGSTGEAMVGSVAARRGDGVEEGVGCASFRSDDACEGDEGEDGYQDQRGAGCEIARLGGTSSK